MRLLLPLILLELLSVKTYATSQALVMNPDKRLKALISCDSMNRLAVANDRITQILGTMMLMRCRPKKVPGNYF
jgi:hypothetical protein